MRSKLGVRMYIITFVGFVRITYIIMPTQFDLFRATCAEKSGPGTQVMQQCFILQFANMLCGSICHTGSDYRHELIYCSMANYSSWGTLTNISKGL